MSGKKRTESTPLCDYLPERLSGTLRRERVETSVFNGLTSMGSKGSGGIADGVNLSARRYPALATRKPRMAFSYQRGSGTPHGMFRFGDALYIACGTGLYRTTDGVTMTNLSTVSDTDKQFFVFGDRLFVYPDKLYILNDGSMPHPIELDTGVVEKAEFQGDKITLPAGMLWVRLGFREGDGLRVVNADDDTPAPEGYYRIKKLNGRIATLTTAFSAAYVSNARFQRKVPNLERFCVNGNRVYGILGKDVYVSAAGNATDWYSRSVDGSGPAILHTDTEGDFTACMPWQGYTVFFKSDRIYKLLGSRSDTFSLHDNRGAGIPARLARTLCEVDGALYYLGDSGVYRYRGQEPERLCVGGEVSVTGGCGGTDGVAYYLALERGKEGWRQYVYRPDLGVWYAEDDIHPVCMAWWDGFLWEQDQDGYVWLCTSDGRTGKGRFDERQVNGELESSVTLMPDHAFEPDGCRLTAVYIRATSESGGLLTVSASFGDSHAALDAEPKNQEQLAIFEGRMTDRLLRIPLTPRFCDSVSLRLSMRGDWVIHSVIREYEAAGQ